MSEVILKKTKINGIECTIYESGLLIQSGIIKNTSEIVLPIHFSDNTFSTTISKIISYAPKKKYLEKNSQVKDLNYRKTPHDIEGLKKQHVIYKICTINDTSTGVYVCPINKVAKTLGIPGPMSSSLKGPTKTAFVENVSIDSGVGTGTGTVNEIRLNIGVNQYITLKVDIPGAKVNNLPTGFIFTDNSIVGTVKNPGEYRFNIVSESSMVPVILTATNVIRIS